MKHSVVPLAIAVVLAAGGGMQAAGAVRSPYAVGGEISLVETERCKRYIHVFTNTTEAALFRCKASLTLRGRILVVGGGGAGGYGVAGASGGGGGGGGGGVYEQRLGIEPGTRWNVLVGKGASARQSTTTEPGIAGASSISNGTTCVALVPGGGNGGARETEKSATQFYPTEGAAGGGGNRYCGSGTGTNGTYQSSLFGVTYGPFAGGNAGWDSSYVGGGGGAGAAGAKRNGGEGLASDITGVTLVYGSGGGGGGSLNKSTSSTVRHAPGVGGTRAGQGAEGSYVDSAAVFTPPVPPEPNSGCGGSGGIGGENIADYPKGDARWGASGADGIVIISYEFYKVPFEGGEVTKIAEEGKQATYIHVFTNASEVATLENLTDMTIPVRMLVVGAGGSGGFGLIDASGSGAGGGGGGVYEVGNVPMPAFGRWTIGVGKGSAATVTTDKTKNETAGSSFVSNATACVALVPGGGNGGESSSASNFNKGHPPTDGAGGGGGVRAQTAGGVGTYLSSVFGVAPVGGPFAGGTTGSYNCGGGGGGASAAGSYQNGGEGLASDITGETLVYGSGGGGGAVWTSATSKAPYGRGGTRAGDGASATVENDEPITAFATAPAANSGGGGGGGLGGTIFKSPTATSNPGYGVSAYLRYGTSGADGIVIVRYEWKYDPNPFIPGLLIFLR